MNSNQHSAWVSSFGDSYSKRNPTTVEEMELLYRDEYGMTRTELNETFVCEFPKDSRILEVGCGSGTQLGILKRAGFTDLWGVDVRRADVAHAWSIHPGVNFVCAAAEDLPFRDCYFDVVFTSGLLIHVHPAALTQAIAEIYRCSRRFIWGFEYYSEVPKAMKYRGTDDMLWKRDFRAKFLEERPDLLPITSQQVRHVGSSDIDVMYLLEKAKV